MKKILIKLTVMFIILTSLISICSCTKDKIITTVQESVDRYTLKMEITAPTESNVVKSGFPGNSTIHDINIFIFDKTGAFVQHQFNWGGGNPITTTLPQGDYQIFAIANWGETMSIFNISGINDLVKLKRQFSSPLELNNLNIMTGKCQTVVNNAICNVAILLKRVLAKITLVINQSMLDPEITIGINKIQLCNITNSISLFEDGKAIVPGDIIQNGSEITFPTLSTTHINALPLYLPENMQGDLLPNNQNQIEKVLISPQKDITSYLKIDASYQSKEKIGSVSYRIYPGSNSTSNFDIKRNTWYQITLFLKGNSLTESSWRIDKSDLNNRASQITLSPQNLSFGELNTHQNLTASIYPSDAIDKSITWSSSNPQIASCSNGTVTSISEGTCIIRAVCTNSPWVKDSVVVSVSLAPSQIPTEQINIFPTSLNYTYLTSPSEQLTATILPNDATNKEVIWKSSNENIATVTNSGIVSQRGVGSCYITAESKDGSGTYCSIPISVNYAQATGIEIVEDFTPGTDNYIGAKDTIIDSYIANSQRGTRGYKVRVLPFNAKQDISINWIMTKIKNEPSQIVSMTPKGDYNAIELSAKPLISCSTNRGEFTLKAIGEGMISSINIKVYENIPITFEWLLWNDKDIGFDTYGIVPRYYNHTYLQTFSELPSMLIIGNNGVEYAEPQLEELWKDPALPSNYSAFISWLSTISVHPEHQFFDTRNAYYSIKNQ